MNRTRKSVPRCCFCRKMLIGEDEFGNNPAPLREKGRCCNECNWQLVIPARMAAIQAMKEASQNVHTAD